MNNYEKQAADFLEKYNCTMEVEFIKNDFHFDGDKDKRDIYKITLKRGGRKMVLNFGQSLNCSGKFWVGYKMAGNARHRNALPFNDIKEAQKHSYFNNFVVQKNENFEEPTAYSVLTCLQKYDVGTFEDFCSEFGYDEDSKKAEKTYNAVVKDYKDVCSLFNDEELSELQEIQ